MGPLDAPRRVAMNQPTRALTSGSCNLPEHESSRVREFEVPDEEA